MKLPEERPYMSDDPNVVLPTAVKALATRANEIHKEQYADNTDPSLDGGGLDKKDDAGDVDDVQKVGLDDGSQGETPNPTAEPINHSTKELDNDWKRRYESMKGRYDQAQKQMQEMADRMSQLEETISVISIQKPTAPDSEPIEKVKLVTVEEEEQFGAEFLNVVSKKAQETISPEIGELKKKFDQISNRLDGITNATVTRSRSDMKKKLTDEVPNWMEINRDPEFLSWLALQDRYSGTIRHNMLTKAWDRNDVQRVINFFKGFIDSKAAKAPQGEHTDLEKTSQKVPLATFAAPGRAKTSAAESVPGGEKPTFTRAQIGQFYADVNAGRYRGRDIEKNKLEAEIFTAQRNGRIL